MIGKIKGKEIQFGIGVDEISQLRRRSVNGEWRGKGGWGEKEGKN